MDNQAKLMQSSLRKSVYGQSHQTIKIFFAGLGLLICFCILPPYVQARRDTSMETCTPVEVTIINKIPPRERSLSFKYVTAVPFEANHEQVTSINRVTKLTLCKEAGLYIRANSGYSGALGPRIKSDFPGFKPFCFHSSELWHPISERQIQQPRERVFTIEKDLCGPV